MSAFESAKIMLVEPDARVMEMAVECLTRRFGARITCTAGGEDALDIEIVEPHDLVIADIDLPGMDGIALAAHLKELSDRPVILTSGRPTLSQAVESVRLGVSDFLSKPYAMSGLLDSAEKALRLYRATCRQKRRYRQLRQMTKRVLSQRRELNQRIDLICRDLVGAHRRLVCRVLETEQARRDEN
jgi:DNA-binding NtrC family response regulator